MSMKMKSRSAAKKRIKMTGSGKLKHSKAARKHLLMQKSSKQKGLGNHLVSSSPCFNRRVREALPHLNS